MKACWLLAVVLLVCVMMGGCQRGEDLSRLGPPAQRVLGHWASSTGHEEYFGPLDASGTGKAVFVHEMLPPTHFQYTVVRQDPRAQTVDISLSFPSGAAGGEQAITISKDGQSANVVYADDKKTIALVRVDGDVTPGQSIYAAPAAAPGSGQGGALASNDFWNQVASVANAHHESDAQEAYSRARTQRRSYNLWLQVTALGILLVATLLFGKDAGIGTIVACWGVAIAAAGLGICVLHRPMLAGMVEILAGFVLLARGLFPKSDMLN